MKKFNNWMLTHHPLIWNTRFHIMLPLVVVVNVLFFLSGYCKSLTLATLDWWVWHNNGKVAAFAILIGILLLIGWLMFFLRHNAFKSLMPISPFFLQKQFLIILVLIAGMSSFMLVNRSGTTLKIKTISNHVDLVKDAETINLARHFLPYDANDFLPPRPEVVDTGVTELAIKMDTVAGLSYWNYVAEGNHYEGSAGAQYMRDSICMLTARRWLINHQEDSIANAINQYLLLAKRYGGSYRFNVASHVRSIFNTPDFKILNGTISSSMSDANGGAYIDEGVAINALNTISEARSGPEWTEWLILAYWSLCAALFLFSFRITTIKTWFTAIVVFGLLAAIVGLTTLANDSDKPFFITVLLLTAFSFGFSLRNILLKKNKRTAAIAFLLGLWMLPAIVPMVFVLLSKIARDSYRNIETGYENTSGFHVYQWLNAWEGVWMIGGWLLAFFVALFLMVPLVKKWKANPEE